MEDTLQAGINISLFRDIQAAILVQPLRINMGHWALDKAFQKRLQQEPPCGTVACIAGWAVALSKKIMEDDLFYIDLNGGSIEHQAITELGIDLGQASRLFFTISWPRKFRDRINLYAINTRSWMDYHDIYPDSVSAGTPEYAQVVSDRIDHFISTGE